MNYLQCCLLLIVELSMSGAQNATFCQEPYENTLCQGNHVACITYFNTVVNCPSDAAPMDLTNLKRWILYKHNSYRNQLALGQTPGMPTASKMPTLVSFTLNSKIFWALHLTFSGLEWPFRVFCAIKCKFLRFCTWPLQKNLSIPLGRRKYRLD